jgi:hypothetical protein
MARGLGALLNGGRLSLLALKQALPERRLVPVTPALPHGGVL